jgi:hypothetical protein
MLLASITRIRHCLQPKLTCFQNPARVLQRWRMQRKIKTAPPMPPDPRRVKRVMITGGVAIAVFIVVLLLSNMFWAGFAATSCWCVLGVILIASLPSPIFRCPECSTPIRSPTCDSDSRQKKIIYHCKPCQIYWDTGDTISGPDVS